MLLGVFGVGPVELLVVGGMLILISWAFRWPLPPSLVVAGSASTARFPSPAGVPKVVRVMKPSDEPISPCAKWYGRELEVTSDGRGPQRLFEVPL
jgi:hypothetical protein